MINKLNDFLVVIKDYPVQINLNLINDCSLISDFKSLESELKLIYTPDINLFIQF